MTRERERREELQRHLADITAEHNQELSEIITAKEKAESELFTAQNELKDVHARFGVELEQLKQTNVSLVQRNEQLNQQILALTHDNATVPLQPHEDLTQEREVSEKLSHEVATLKRELDNRTEQERLTGHECHQLKNDLSKCRSDLEDLKSDLAARDGDIGTMQQRHAQQCDLLTPEARKDLEQVTTERDTCLTQVRELNNRYEIAVNQLKQNQTTPTNVREKEVNDLVQHRDQLLMSLDSAQKDMATLSKKLQSSEEQVTTLTREGDTLNQQLEQEKERIARNNEDTIAKMKVRWLTLMTSCFITKTFYGIIKTEM